MFSLYSQAAVYKWVKWESEWNKTLEVYEFEAFIALESF